MPENITPRQAALWFAAQGHAVLPLHSINDAGACTCGRSDCPSPGKHPYAPLAPNGVKNATCSAPIIKAWFDEAYWLNYGTATDQLLVIDVDTKHDGLKKWTDLCGEPTRPLIHTWQVRTGSGGLHVMFKNTAKIRAGGLDTVISARSSCGRPTSIQEWRKIAGTKLQEGDRNRVRLAGHLVRNPLLDPYVIIELLVGWDRGMCEPPLGAKRVAYIVEDLFAKQTQREAWLSCPAA
jgi:hypothetical protein